MGELADEQRQTATVTLQQQKAQADLAQTKAEQAKEPPQPVPDPLQAPGQPPAQPPQQKAPPGPPQAQQKPAQPKESADTSAQQVDWWPDNLDKQLGEYRKQGVECLKWLCQSNACDLCFANDGQVRKVGDAFPNGAILPQCHDHCECGVEPTEKPKED